MKRGRKTVFSATFELELVDYVKHMASIFYGITKSELRRLAYELAEAKGVQHNFDRNSKVAGMQWTRLFLKRHPDLTLRSPEPTSISRLQGFRKSEVDLFFSNLESLVAQHGYSASRVFNVDETAISTVTEPPKVLAAKGARRVRVVSSAERGQHTTAVLCCNAAGGFIPPQMIFARKRMNPRLRNGAPPGTLFDVSDNGWATRETFTSWFQHFMRETGATKEAPTLLLMDNHSSHLSLEVL